MPAKTIKSEIRLSIFRAINLAFKKMPKYRRPELTDKRAYGACLEAAAELAAPIQTRESFLMEAADAYDEAVRLMEWRRNLLKRMDQGWYPADAA
jgi:hypothetical protein